MLKQSPPSVRGVDGFEKVARSDRYRRTFRQAFSSGGCLLALFVILGLLIGCTGKGAEIDSLSVAKAQDPLAQAAVEATAILQNARATAIVLKAQTQADALILQAQQPPEATAEQASLPTSVVVVQTGSIPTIQNPVQSTAELLPLGTPTNIVLDLPVIARQGDFELLGVTFAADGGFIMVSFTAPPNQVAQIYQGTVSITDESNGAVYDEIPVMPVIGPMVGRPVEAGQRGYVMLVNKSPGLRPGALVTIVMGEVKFEHIPVQQ